MKRLSMLLLCVAIIFVTIASSMAWAADIVGKWELVRVEDAQGKAKLLPPKPKMGGAEFFKDKTVLFSDGLKGEWSVSEDGGITIILMEFLEMSGAVQGDLLKLTAMADPNEILVLKKK